VNLSCTQHKAQDSPRITHTRIQKPIQPVAASPKMTPIRHKISVKTRGHNLLAGHAGGFARHHALHPTTRVTLIADVRDHRRIKRAARRCLRLRVTDELLADLLTRGVGILRGRDRADESQSDCNFHDVP